MPSTVPPRDAVGATGMSAGVSRTYAALSAVPHAKNRTASHATTTTGCAVELWMAMLTAVIGAPTTAPATMPDGGPGRAPRRPTVAKNAAPAPKPTARNRRTAAICSAALAVAATLRPASLSVAIIRSMPVVISGPGRTRAIQSNRSNGANGRPASSFARYMTPMTGAASSPPTSAPTPRLDHFICFSDPGPERGPGPTPESMMRYRCCDAVTKVTDS